MPVGDEQTLLRVEHDQALAHVVERGVEHAIGGFQLRATPRGLKHHIAEDGDGARHVADLVGIIERGERGDAIGVGEP